ncbi:uncharacterized protein LOC134793097 [Cydia splendana]|uniref:uncharacterized protein LOC134793097 n=1 Tax=Cydia splendana TaxID=1100963 RepID=UPI00300D4758
MDWNHPPEEQAGTSTPQSSAPKIAQMAERGNQSKLEEMYRKQQSNFKAFQRAINNTRLELLTERWEFEDALKTVQARWTAIDTLHWEIDSEQINEKPEYEETYNQCEQKYNDIKKRINIKMWDSSHREKSTPKIEIPIFNGNYHQWTSFKDLFTETIHKNNSISNAQKMQFLKSKVKGEAEKLIQHLKISTDNYQVCWEILNHRYNNTKLIFSSHVNILLGLPTMQQQTAVAIKRLHDNTKECLHAIQNLGVDSVDTSTWDPLIVHLLAQKLDADSHHDYVEHVADPRELPTLAEFLSFLEAKFTALESSRRKQEQTKPVQHTNYEKRFGGKPSSYQNPRSEGVIKENRNYHYSPNKNYQGNQAKNHQSFSSNNFKCPCCTYNHDLFRCSKFLGMTPETKLATITTKEICPNCLYKHYGNPCLSEKRCKQCNGEHNTILHEAFVSKKKGATNEQSTSKNVVHVFQDEDLDTLLSTAQIKVQTKDGSYIKFRALIDPGSQLNLISENAAQLLGLPRQNYSGTVFGIGKKESSCKGFTIIKAESMHTDYTFTTKVYIMNRLTIDLPNESFIKPLWPHLEGLQLADPEFNVSNPIDILLGAGVYARIILGSVLRVDDVTPIALDSHLGWLLCGDMKSYHCNMVLNNIEDISRFWAIEDIAENSDNLSTEDQYCINQYKSETTRRGDGRYVVRLPLKPDIEEKLGESRNKVVAQFYQLERKLMKNEKLSEGYKSFINEYYELGHMRECERDTQPSNYLPHHCVQRAESSTTALRVVYNASAPTSSGYSLNDEMYSGPNLQSDLFKLILRWRQYKIVFLADIEKMFRQILCHEKDQLYQKIIWRDHPKQTLREYALTTVTYGTKAAPFLAMMTLKQLALDEGHQYPEAAKILDQDFYMDDLLSGTHDIISAKKLQTDLINLLRAGGFNLRKWSSNNPRLLEGVDTTKQQSFDFKHQESQKTLGLRWNPQDDEFTFQLKIQPSPTGDHETLTIIRHFEDLRPSRVVVPYNNKTEAIISIGLERRRFEMGRSSIRNN